MADIEHIYQGIRARRAEIQRQRIVLEQEDAELAVTERHIARFLPSGDGLVPIGSVMNAVVQDVATRFTPTRASMGANRKPKGIPTIFRMACDVLRESARNGKPWLDSQEITNEIKARWWPSVETSAVQPQLWRAATKRKALLKDGTRYALPSRTISPTVSGESYPREIETTHNEEAPH